MPPGSRSSTTASAAEGQRSKSTTCALCAKSSRASVLGDGFTRNSVELNTDSSAAAHVASATAPTRETKHNLHTIAERLLIDFLSGSRETQLNLFHHSAHTTDSMFQILPRRQRTNGAAFLAHGLAA
jgi:hypothetical protein